MDLLPPLGLGWKGPAVEAPTTVMDELMVNSPDH